ncbi:bifunctional 5,10-methylenetetrahydrofolate dehydrogenase/5,10-methenyltetrahydrofolate cyclohydrolase [Fuchsiella alkaliacetigena]|uniref:bifunctional 5,10-methylenetetrahydrofolate dehydrogenase/5,10-methenyltetrahydrofolate cyclohydrolase n=1 Tax=Fuchsiella alkaliacetigena TaxID=957042 RepID=UPI00200B2442|nr:bifunctional 5,10-methylenetetrahydrofolate dehydrogenase/5,10-methenyltetrahydrofolate cyclohydrolase [Fuchsiella alkaliacetigena]MCK8825445.1 bifunctional 5,10-methylenetetrahydrofolate dehydrogenase/5,10-methenyltetrahydrofolate cyclohydrolase [Fuchsiella alkaliacetigena]
MSEETLILDGSAKSSEIQEEIKAETAKLKEEEGVVPKLSIVFVGDSPASASYIKLQQRICEKVGIDSEVIDLEDDVSEEKLLAELDKLNNDDQVNGILMQMPLPDHIDDDKVIRSINPQKDLDSFHPYNLGEVVLGGDAYQPCTPEGVMALLDMYDIDVKGKDVAIVGHSNIVGKPLALMMLNRNATVSVCHIDTKDTASYTKEADIVAVAAGVPNLITADMVKEGAIVIDIGINQVDGKIVGDVDYENVKEKASAITPVPGGAGPMTIAMLLKDTVKSCKEML